MNKKYSILALLIIIVGVSGSFYYFQKYNDLIDTIQFDLKNRQRAVAYDIQKTFSIVDEMLITDSFTYDSYNEMFFSGHYADLDVLKYYYEAWTDGDINQFVIFMNDLHDVLHSINVKDEFPIPLKQKEKEFFQKAHPILQQQNEYISSIDIEETEWKEFVEGLNKIAAQYSR